MYHPHSSLIMSVARLLHFRSRGQTVGFIASEAGSSTCTSNTKIPALKTGRPRPWIGLSSNEPGILPTRPYVFSADQTSVECMWTCLSLLCNKPQLDTHLSSWYCILMNVQFNLIETRFVTDSLQGPSRQQGPIQYKDTVLPVLEIPLWR